MFQQLAASLDPDPAIGGNQVFAYHPMQLGRFLEEAWINRPVPPIGLPTNLEVPAVLRPQEATSGIPFPPLPALWDHLIYAYMIENTRAFEIFRRVLEEYAYGERLGTPSDETQRWFRTTEQLFYSPEPPYQVYALTSSIRPDIRASRRNAYFRMFGMDLNHGTDDGRPYQYPRASASNTEFVATFEGLLREVWLAFENFTNTSGARPTDDAAIANLARRLFDMLTVRRESGNLNREELLHSSTMSWLHLTLSFDSPVVTDLEAQASSPEERLLKIGERVGLPAHSRAGAYFRLAPNMSVILRAVELAQFNQPGNAQALYTPPTVPPPPPLQSTPDMMIAIVRDWSIASGRDMKARQVSVGPPEPVTIRPPARPIVPAGTNGRGDVSPDLIPS